MNTPSTITLTDAAARRLKAVTATSTTPNSFVRLTVLGGGCSGFRYQFDLDHQQQGDDISFHHNDAQLVIDQTSLSLLNGSVIDYGETLMESGFRITNPNATSGCGCGSSFGI